MASKPETEITKRYTEEQLDRIVAYDERLKREPVKFKKGKGGSPGSIDLDLEESKALLAGVQCMEALGTPDVHLQGHLISQMVRTFAGATSSGGHNEEKAVDFCNLAMAILNGVQPRDEIEGLLAVQMVGVHNAAMACLGRAMISGQTFDGKQASVNQATKLLRTFTTQIDALKKYRTGGEQKVTVEHVHVNEGGQAIVGNIRHGGGGSYEKKGV